MSTEKINPAIINPAIGAIPASPAPAKPLDNNKVQFQDVLKSRLQETKPLQWSGHALQRLEKRNIDLGEVQLTRLDDAVAKASGKGSRSALVLIDDLAFVVAVNNRTVVTALDRSNMREHVFTNIDTAVLA